MDLKNGELEILKKGACPTYIKKSNGEFAVIRNNSFPAGIIDEKLFCEIVKKHGTHRVLFGSDLPWSSPDREIALIDRLPVSSEEKEKIYWKNIAELLELSL